MKFCCYRGASPGHCDPSLFYFWDVRRDSGGGDVRVSPYVRRQCALLEHLNVALSQLHPDSWTMVRAFEILCPFFNIRPSVLVFLFFFQMKLSGKIGWVSLNNISKKLFEFDSNIFRRFKDHFFKVLATGVVTDGMPLMFNRDRVSRFPFYWQSDPTRFKSYGEDLLTLAEKVEKAILEQLPTSLDMRAILSLPSISDPLISLDGKVLNLALVRPTGGIVPSSAIALDVGEGGQPIGEVGSFAVVTRHGNGAGRGWILPP
ncbi:hypothetical protein JHK82_024315 [Glycine max]|nr:hypothetical protein JHK85_024896 [Glycine max]KAG5012148.1 hypothetical protein JHK86_024409 [Glycine max]KAG5133127.1 hypothetical protein JHK82_024315 [Glycine max]